MRACNHLQWSILFLATIEVEPDRNHGFKNSCGRLHMNHSLFDRPRAKSSHFVSFPYTNRPILMPRHTPIPFWCFIKKNCAHRKTDHAKSFYLDLQKLLQLWNLLLQLASPSAILACFGCEPQDFYLLGTVQKLIQHCKAITLDR